MSAIPPPVPSPAREALAEQAARAAAAGRGAAPFWPALRRLSTAELLAAPAPRRAADLAGALRAACAAAQDAVRRPPGWLQAQLPEGGAWAAVSPRLVQAAAFSAMAGALRAGGGLALGCRCAPGLVRLWVRGGAAGRTSSALWRALAAQAGGRASFADRPPFTALLCLPAAPAQGGKKTAAQAQDLLADRYGLLYAYLAGFCAAPEP